MTAWLEQQKSPTPCQMSYSPTLGVGHIGKATVLTEAEMEQMPLRSWNTNRGSQDCLYMKLEDEAGAGLESASDC